MGYAQIAKNSAAVINGIVVSPGSFQILRALYELRQPSIVPAIWEHLNETPSKESLYSILKRLLNKELVDREERIMDTVILDRHYSCKRILWTLKPDVISFFDELTQEEPAK